MLSSHFSSERTGLVAFGRHVHGILTALYPEISGLLFVSGMRQWHQPDLDYHAFKADVQYGHPEQFGRPVLELQVELHLDGTRDNYRMDSFEIHQKVALILERFEPDIRAYMLRLDPNKDLLAVFG